MEREHDIIEEAQEVVECHIYKLIEATHDELKAERERGAYDIITRLVIDRLNYLLDDYDLINGGERGAYAKVRYKLTKNGIEAKPFDAPDITPFLKRKGEPPTLP